jgi:hypothetical protein
MPVYQLLAKIGQARPQTSDVIDPPERDIQAT